MNMYSAGHALISSLESRILVKNGHLLENSVFTGLRRIASRISYLRNQLERETDFVVQLQEGV